LLLLSLMLLLLLRRGPAQLRLRRHLFP